MLEYAREKKVPTICKEPGHKNCEHVLNRIGKPFQIIHHFAYARPSYKVRIN